MLTGESYVTSAEMAKEHGPFSAYYKNRDHMLRVVRNHRRAAYDAPPEMYEGLTIKPVGLSPETTPPDLLAAARDVWNNAIELGTEHGFRNAQAERDIKLLALPVAGVAQHCSANSLRDQRSIGGRIEVGVRIHSALKPIAGI